MTIKTKTTSNISIDDILFEIYELFKLRYSDITKHLLFSPQVINCLTDNDQDIESHQHFSARLHYINEPYFLLHSMGPITRSILRFEDVVIRDGWRNMVEWTKWLVDLIGEWPGNKDFTNQKYIPHNNYLIAVTYYKYNLFLKSIDYYNRAWDHFKGKNALAFLCDWGKTLFRIRDFDSANKKFQIASEKNPDKWWIYSSWADCLSRYSFHKESIEKDAIAIKLSPQDKSFYFDAGYRTVRNHLNYFDHLDKLSVLALMVNIDTFSFYKEIGIRYYEEREYENAYQLFKKALKINADDWEIHSWVAKTLYNKVEYEEAVKEFEISSALDVDNALDHESKNLWDSVLIGRGQYMLKASVVSKTSQFYPKEFQPYPRNPDDVRNDDIEFWINKLNNTKEREHQLKAFYWGNIASLYRGLNEKKKKKHARSRAKIESSYYSEKSLKLDFIEVIKESGQQFPALEKLLGINIDTQIFNEPAKKNILVLIPRHKEGKLHKNEIVWMDKTGEKHTKSGIGNTPFDFLYYIASLHNKGEKGMKIDEGISEEQKYAVFPEYENYNRFDSSPISGDKVQMPKIKSNINGYFDFDIIKQENIYYTINSEITIELKPYPSK